MPQLQELRELLIGQTLFAGAQACRQTLPDQPNLRLRVVQKDGQDCMVTCEFCPERVNVAVVDNVIRDVISLG